MSPELEAARAKAEVLDSEGHLYAQAAWREAADGALKAYGENDPRVHAARARLARSLLLHGWLDYRESRETAAAAGAALAAAAAASPGGAGGKEGRQLAEEAAAALSVEAWAALQGGELGPAREILARALALLPGGEDKARGALALALRSRLAQALVAKGLDRSPPGEAQAGKALELFAGCADEAAVIYGPGSPEARRARLGVASALAALGRPEEAEAWLEEAFAEEGCAGGCAGYLGPEALRCARLIADFFKGEGLLDRAGEMYLRILRAELEQTAACGRPCLEPAASLAGLYWPPQSPARRELLLRAAGILDGILGPLDPGTIEAKKTAADALFGYSDSVALLREAWDAQKRTLGEDSPEAAETARILAGRLTRLEGFELASPAAADLAWSLREEGRGLSLLLFERDLRARGAGGLEAESGLSCVRAEAFFRLELPFQVLECRDRLSVMERVLGPRHPAAAAERRELAAAADRVGGGPLLALAMRDLPGAGGAPEVAAPAPWGPPGDPRESLAAEALAAEDWAAAADMYRGLLELRDSGPGPESPEAARAALGLARALP
ncbi:MAG: hypothetical protein LBW85_12160 [Deltaproteobacteria bacterium]|jgi:tetratricopeptide (TPR) repeat protein|nr:hypothetical protein [Deltaproteobacteria bacterium]